MTLEVQSTAFLEAKYMASSAEISTLAVEMSVLKAGSAARLVASENLMYLIASRSVLGLPLEELTLAEDSHAEFISGAELQEISFTAGEVVINGQRRFSLDKSSGVDDMAGAYLRLLMQSPHLPRRITPDMLNPLMKTRHGTIGSFKNTMSRGRDRLTANLSVKFGMVAGEYPIWSAGKGSNIGFSLGRPVNTGETIKGHVV